MGSVLRVVLVVGRSHSVQSDEVGAPPSRLPTLHRDPFGISAAGGFLPLPSNETRNHQHSDNRIALRKMTECVRTRATPFQKIMETRCEP